MTAAKLYETVRTVSWTSESFKTFLNLSLGLNVSLVQTWFYHHEHGAARSEALKGPGGWWETQAAPSNLRQNEPRVSLTEMGRYSQKTKVRWRQSGVFLPFISLLNNVEGRWVDVDFLSHKISLLGSLFFFFSVQSLQCLSQLLPFSSLRLTLWLVSLCGRIKAWAELFKMRWLSLGPS